MAPKRRLFRRIAYQLGTDEPDFAADEIELLRETARRLNMTSARLLWTVAMPVVQRMAAELDAATRPIIQNIEETS